MNRKRCLIILLLFVLSVNSSGRQASAQTASTGNDFEVKGFHLDLRIQVMKMPALKALALRLKKDGYNTLIMEYEGTYPYLKHPLISNRYAYTRAEIVNFVSYCNLLGIDVIPLQQSFGHVEYILRNNRYASQREDQTDLSQICPSRDSLNRVLFTDLYTDLASTHTSKYIHIGCDETHLLGHCPICKAKLQNENLSQLYVDHIKLLCDIVIRLGKIPVLWADIALKYPDAIQQLPKQVVFVDWNYGWDLNRFGDHNKLMNSGFEMWGAAALRSGPDNYNLVMWDKHFNNIRDFVPQSRSLGYKGMIMTSWSTSGVYDPVFESGSDLIDLIAVRRVYPITAFNMYIDAFGEALLTRSKFNTEDFIVRYCRNTFGLNRSTSLLFWKALKSAPYEVVNNKVAGPLTLKQLADSAALTAKTLKAIEPVLNKNEFAQFVLFAHIRQQYLNYQLIEAEANSANISNKRITKLTGKLQQVMTAMKGLNKEYIRLNKSVFYTSELAIDNELHIAKMQLLYNKMNRIH